MACPNKNLKDWGDLVDKFGEDGAYYIYMKNGDTIPYLQGRESNRFIWDVENSLGLISWKKDNGKNTKQYKGFSQDDTSKLVSKIRDEYTGNFTIKHISPDTVGDYGIKITGYPLSKIEVDKFAESINKESEESESQYRQYKEFKQREEEANEDIIPPEHYDQRDIFYNNSEYKETNEEQFNEQQISELEKILNSSMPQIKELIQDRKLEVLGRLEGGGETIRYNPDTMTKSTIGHEFGHLLIDLRGGLNNPFILDGIDQLNGTDLANKIREKYSDLSEEQIQKEILAEAIGREAADIFENEQDKSKFEKWLLRLFRWLGNRTGISKNNARLMASELLAGKPIDSSKFTGEVSIYSQDQISSGETFDPTSEYISDEIPNPEEEEILNKEESKLLDKYQKLRNSAINIINTRIDKSVSSGQGSDVEELRTLLESVSDESNRDKNAIFQFATNSSRYIGKLYSQYQDLLEQEKTNPEAFKIKTIVRWHDILSSYDVLDDIVTLIQSDGFLGVDGKLDTKYSRSLKIKLQDIIAKKNELRDLYNTKGHDMALDALETYSSNVIINKKAEKRKEWAKNNRDKKYSREDRKRLEDEYAEQYIKENITDLTKQTRVLLKSEMDKASGDVSLIKRWLDTMLDSDDVLLIAMTKKIVIQDGLAREKAIDFKNEAWPLVQQMYKESNYTYGSTDLSKVYDFMLEKNDKGKRTGFVIGKFRSDLMSEYASFKLSKEHLDVKERRKLLNNWKEENMPLNSKKLKEARELYLQELKKDGIITEEDVNLINNNFSKPHERRSKLDDIVNKTAADLIEKWSWENSMSFREPIAKWANPQWDSLQNKLKANPNSAETKFYNLIRSEIENINRQLPYDKRIYDQLPFRFKDLVERKTSGQKISKLMEEEFKNLTTRRIDEVDRGQYTDENDRPIDYMPFHYSRPKERFEFTYSYQLKTTDIKSEIAAKKGKVFKTHTRVLKADSGEEAIQKLKNSVVDIDENSISKLDVKEIKWTDEDQSYDLMGLYYSFFKMANRYVLMSEILPEVDLVKRIAENRQYTRKDHSGNPIMKKIGKDSHRPTTKEGSEAYVVDMFKDFVANTMYGQGKVEEGSWDVFGWKFDKAKMRDGLGKYASYTMLGLNAVQGVANVSLGELQQITESIAGEYFTTKDLHKATVSYNKELPTMASDIGQEVGNSKITHLNETWDILNEYDSGKYVKNSRFSKLMSSSVLFFMANAGEHFMQTRVMIAMLSKQKAFDKNGKEIGNMYDMYSVVNGKLVLSDEVDLAKSNWDAEQRVLFGAKVKRLLARLHGEYSDIGKNAAQRYSVGRMGMMFRKFIIPGYKKRWGKRAPNEFLGEMTEGSYTAIFNFAKKAVMETRALGFAAFTENWKELSTREQANMLRGASEFGFGLVLMALAGAFLTLKGEADDDLERASYAMAAYIALRVKSEMFFYINPEETLTIIKSPAVTTSVIENIIKLAGQLIPPYEIYERGSWKDNPKILKTIFNLTPGVKQYYKVKNIEDGLTFFIK